MERFCEFVTNLLILLNLGVMSDCFCYNKHTYVFEILP